MYEIAYTKEANDRIGKLDTKKKEQIKHAIERIAKDPDIGKRLLHEFSGLLSYRSGDYRIIYRIYHDKVLILILTIGHRKDIYKQLSRKLS